MEDKKRGENKEGATWAIGLRSETANCANKGGGRATSSTSDKRGRVQRNMTNKFIKEGGPDEPSKLKVTKNSSNGGKIIKETGRDA